MDFLNEYLWIIFAALSGVVLIIFLFMVFSKKGKNKRADHQQTKQDYEYYGIDKTAKSNRKYIMMTLLDYDKTKYERLKLESIVHQGFISMHKLLKSKKRDAQYQAQLIDSKVVVVHYPVYLLMEILPADINRLEDGEDVVTEYIDELKNLLFYSEHIHEIKEFIENR